MSAAKFVQRFVNRNPRNLERLRLQSKPSGWDFERHRDQKNCIYRIDFHPTKNSTSASVVHYEDGTVVQASTTEPSVQAQLYSPSDVSAAYNIGRLLAQRALMADIRHCVSGIPEQDMENSKRRAMFLQALCESGIQLEEPECIPHTHLNDPKRVWEPFVEQQSRQTNLDELDLTLEPGKGVC